MFALETREDLLTSTNPELYKSDCCSPSKGVGTAGVVSSSVVRGGKLDNGSSVVLISGVVVFNIIGVILSKEPTLPESGNWESESRNTSHI